MCLYMVPSHLILPSGCMDGSGATSNKKALWENAQPRSNQKKIFKNAVDQPTTCARFMHCGVWIVTNACLPDAPMLKLCVTDLNMLIIKRNLHQICVCVCVVTCVCERASLLHSCTATPFPPLASPSGLNGTIVYSRGLADIACYRIPAVVQVCRVCNCEWSLAKSYLSLGLGL